MPTLIFHLQKGLTIVYEKLEITDIAPKNDTKNQECRNEIAISKFL